MNRDRAKQNARHAIALRGYGPVMRGTLEHAVELAIDAIADELERDAGPGTLLAQAREMAPAARARYAEAQTASPYDLQAQAELRAADARGRKGYDY
jgi:hypothetical protein